MASKYDFEKVTNELSKIPTEDLKKEFGFIKDFVQKKLEAAQAEAEETANKFQQQIESL